VNDAIFERRRGDLLVSTDRARLDIDLIHRVLATTYWASGIPRDVVARAIAGSIAFGLYENGQLVGFARVISDLATYAYLADVFVVEPWRDSGIGQRLVERIQAHPDLQGLRRWMLVTRSAQSLYRRCGFTEPPPLYSVMERVDGEVYERGAS
jgi:N-acetylglutamate synthase-like GNAT family acetyltransferase